MKKLVVMPGGFHPFHAGHLALYQSAKKAFPDAEVYVAATNDQSERPFPFALKEKLAKLAGVEPGHFIQVKSPFQAKEITQNYDPDQDVLIFVRSEKDRTEQPQPGGTKKDGSPAYFQPYTGKDLQPFSKHAYMAYLPTVEFGPGITSATQIRKAWPTLNDKRKTAMVMSLYPATQKNPKLAQNVVGMFDQVMGGQVDEGAEEALQYATQAHAGQTRSGGEPYITHPMRVADHIKQYKQSHNLDALISAAYLHDTVEDTDTTHEALHDLFGGLVASLVQELTSDPEQIKKVGKAQYLAHKMAAMSSYALVIKLADRLDNVKDITTARTPQWRQKYKNETEHILNYIEKTRALSGTHQKLISLIRDKLSELDNQPKSDSNLAENLDYLEEK
jgi:glycerol-3-phosphate cytidylyltransferase-like family protein